VTLGHDPVLSEIRKKLHGKEKVDDTDDESTVASDASDKKMKPITQKKKKDNVLEKVQSKSKQKAKATKNKKKVVIDSSDDDNELDKVQLKKNSQKVNVSDTKKQLKKNSQKVNVSDTKKQRSDVVEDNRIVIESTKKLDVIESNVNDINSTSELNNEHTMSPDHASNLQSTQDLPKDSKRASNSSKSTVATHKSKRNTQAKIQATPPLTPNRKTISIRDTWVKGIVENFLNTPPGKVNTTDKVTTRIRNVNTLKYNAKEVSKKLKEKKEAAKGTRAKKCLKKQVNTMTQNYSPIGRNKKNNLKTVVKKGNKTEDKVADEEEYDYEIKPYIGLPHKEMHNNDDNDPNPLPEKILNLRKVKGWKLEVLVQYINTVREWTCIHGVVHDLKDETSAFMKTYGLTFPICGYSVDPSNFTEKQMEKIVSTDDYEPPIEFKIKPKATFPRDDIDYLELSKLIHRKLQKLASFLESPTGQVEIVLTPTRTVEYVDEDQDDDDDNADIYSSIMSRKTTAPTGTQLHSL
jgi:hypothetical protein